MNALQRQRLDDIAKGRFMAPFPTAEDIRILLAENALLQHLLDDAIKEEASTACDRLLEKRG